MRLGDGHPGPGRQRGRAVHGDQVGGGGGGVQLRGVDRSRFLHQGAVHVQGADRVARRDVAAGADRRRADRAVARQRRATRDIDGGSGQRCVHRQGAGLDAHGARHREGADEVQPPRPLLGEAAGTADAVRHHRVGGLIDDQGRIVHDRARAEARGRADQRAGRDAGAAGVAVRCSDPQLSGALLGHAARAADAVREHAIAGLVEHQGRVVHDAARAEARGRADHGARRDDGAAGVRVLPGEHQRAGAGLDQAAAARDRARGAEVRIGLHHATGAVHGNGARGVDGAGVLQRAAVEGQRTARVAEVGIRADRQRAAGERPGRDGRCRARQRPVGGARLLEDAEAAVLAGGADRGNVEGGISRAAQPQRICAAEGDGVAVEHRAGVDLERVDAARELDRVGLRGRIGQAGKAVAAPSAGDGAGVDDREIGALDPRTAAAGHDPVGQHARVAAGTARDLAAGQVGDGAAVHHLHASAAVAAGTGEAKAGAVAARTAGEGAAVGHRAPAAHENAHPATATGVALAQGIGVGIGVAAATAAGDLGTGLDLDVGRREHADAATARACRAIACARAALDARGAIDHDVRRGRDRGASAASAACRVDADHLGHAWCARPSCDGAADRGRCIDPEADRPRRARRAVHAAIRADAGGTAMPARTRRQIDSATTAGGSVGPAGDVGAVPSGCLVRGAVGAAGGRGVREQRETGTALGPGCLPGQHQRHGHCGRNSRALRPAASAGAARPLVLVLAERDPRRSEAPIHSCPLSKRVKTSFHESLTT
ncbi:hypothetical protein APY03_6384 [Variovorax sp. WDL1]|nr:hypothetical protein APY03_6384 [Variovorax sp. WDL1]